MNLPLPAPAPAARSIVPVPACARARSHAPRMHSELPSSMTHPSTFDAGGRWPPDSRAWCFNDQIPPRRPPRADFREPIGGKSGTEHARTEDGGLWVSLPGFFKTNGYLTMGGGKTYHPNLPPDNDGNLSWSLGDRGYVSFGDVGGCSSDYFNYTGR